MDRLRRHINKHINKHLVSGLLIVLPLGITILILKFLFGLLAGILMPVPKRFLGAVLPDWLLFLIALTVFAFLIYLIGMITAHMVGRRIVALGEALITRIPLLKTIYSASKKLVDTFSISSNVGFKSTVLMEFPRQGLWSIAFVTGHVRDQAGEEYLRVFLPTVPNITTGYLLFVKSHEVVQSDVTVDEAVRMFFSFGVLGPDQLKVLLPRPKALPAAGTAGAERGGGPASEATASGSVRQGI